MELANQPLTHKDYTVGWVCALPKEQTAATAMLDGKIHPELPKPPNDHNTYTLGSIGNHNIVIACLPKGKIGTNPAAAAVALMITTFPAIRIGLMVGIGGGIPPHVRLGDVVVSTPTANYPGVVQWDLGKTEHGGGFKRTGSLNNPPYSLLTALTKLETKHEMEGSKIPDILEEMGRKWPRLAQKYLRSDLLEDVLFGPEYPHVTGNTGVGNAAVTHSAGDNDENCQYCDRSQAIQRKSREMQVHYGLIASGNKVIKDAIFRDELCQSLGGSVLCVEMEAAGLMNTFPCIVIRGICDYADSHKNKVWQEHAAALAAAYAKELLGYIQPSDVVNEQTVKEILDDISGGISSINENVVYTRSRLDKKEDLEILDWLIPTDYGPQQTDYFRRREPGTGQWLLESKEYQNWIKEPKETLLCPGIPGAGKTVLASIIVNDLETMFSHDPAIAVCYVYCNYKRQDEQTVEHLLSSLLKQLAQSQPSLPHSLKELCNRHAKRTRPSLDEITSAFESIALQNSRVFIVVDALDECQGLNRCRTSFLSTLFSLQMKTGVNILATSRIIPEIMGEFKNSPLKEIRAPDDDIRRYLRSRLPELPKFVMDQCSLRDDITTSITEAASGMFLLAQLHFSSLIGKDTPKAIRKALQSLVTGSQAYDAAYELAMRRIRGQVQEQAERAKQVLSWVTCAQRPLTTFELQHALAVEIDEVNLDRENLPQIEDAVSVCAGLVTVDEESNVVRLVHYTTQEYFIRTQHQWFPNAQRSITEICITYLSYQDFASGCCTSDEAFERRLVSYPFYDYAACNWGYHGRNISNCLSMVSFLQKPAAVEASYQVLCVKRTVQMWSYSEVSPKRITGLHLAAYFGLEEVVASIPGDSNAKDIRNGHEAIVKLLLATKRVNPDLKDIYSKTPLLKAARNRHKAIVKLLLATKRVNPDLKNIYS
ncbi:hypothetical protein F5Y14DRAFT_441857 [Nemania sp. NC0429]|nr:hypothetical protein F5Y14DRAFT_441857 [Nemania sp. NC0429]